MQTILSTLIQEVQEETHIISMDRYYTHFADRKTYRIPARLEALYWVLIQYPARLTCKLFGHQLQDHSHAGPDSGCVDLTCARCGWGVHHTLY